MVNDMTDYAANLALFVSEHTGTVLGTWRGKLNAADQRKLFGRYLGKGLLVIDGERERVRMIVKVCFGLDFDVRADLAWRDFN